MFLLLKIVFLLLKIKCSIINIIISYTIALYLYAFFLSYYMFSMACICCNKFTFHKSMHVYLLATMGLPTFSTTFVLPKSGLLDVRLPFLEDC